IQFCKRIVLVNLSIIVCIQEFSCVITGESEGHLCQVVGTEAEEVSFFCDLVSGKSSSRDLDHGTYFVLQVDACCSDLCVSSLNYEFLYVFQLFDLSNQRDHDLRLDGPVR